MDLCNIKSSDSLCTYTYGEYFNLHSHSLILKKLKLKMCHSSNSIMQHLVVPFLQYFNSSWLEKKH